MSAVRFLITGHLPDRDQSSGHLLPGRLDQIVWRDGEGVELGTIRGGWDEIMRAATTFVWLGADPSLELFSVTEDGLSGILILGLDSDPVILTEPEDHLPDVIGIVGGKNSDADAIVRRIQHLISVGVGSQKSIA